MRSFLCRQHAYHEQRSCSAQQSASVSVIARAHSCALRYCFLSHDRALQAQAAGAAAAASGDAAAQASSPAQPQALAVFRRPLLGASPRLSSAFELPSVVGALGYSLSPVQVSCLFLREPASRTSQI